MKVILIIGIIAVVLYFYHKWFKILKLTNVVFISGGVKAGKSSLSVYLALRKYKSSLRVYRIKKVIMAIFPKKNKVLEKPLLYSNVPLATEYVPLTEDLVLRKKRFAYGSVIYIQEASLLADTMDYKDDAKNDALKLFNKLIAHETKGGILIYDSQSPHDLHHSIRRCLSSYFYIHHSKKVPFFMIAYVREMIFSEENGVSNVFEDDVETTLRRVIIPKSVWKKFDCYTYSALTDDLPAVCDTVDGKKLANLKSNSYLTLKKKNGGIYVKK